MMRHPIPEIAMIAKCRLFPGDVNPRAGLGRHLATASAGDQARAAGLAGLEAGLNRTPEAAGQRDSD
jgi:hypothetical protein